MTTPLPDGFDLGRKIRERFEKIERDNTTQDQRIKTQEDAQAEFERALRELIVEFGGKLP